MVEQFDMSLRPKETQPMPEQRMLNPIPSERQLCHWSSEKHEAHGGLGWLSGFAVRYNCLQESMSRILKASAGTPVESLLSILKETEESLPYRTGCYEEPWRYFTSPSSEIEKLEREFRKAVRDCVDGCRYGIEFLTQPTRILKRPHIFKFELYKTTLESVPGRMNKIYEKSEHLREIYLKRLGDYNPFVNQ